VTDPRSTPAHGAAARRTGDPLWTRRALLRAGVGGASLALGTGVNAARAATPAALRTGFPVGATFNFNQNWRFGGLYEPGSENPGYRDSSFAPITLPHTVTPLSWGDWDSLTWEAQWIYRKRFSTRRLPLGRVLLAFDGAMTNATVYLNGLQVASHLGGYLPFTVELTDVLRRGDNVLAVVVDGMALDVPPASPAGDAAIDYLQPAGINRDVALRVVPFTYVSDVFTRAAYVLSGSPELLTTVTIDSAIDIRDRATITVELLSGSTVVASKSTQTRIHAGQKSVVVRMLGLKDIALWSPASPTLYTVQVTLSGPQMPSHTVDVTTGFRDATFTTEGFILNGERLQIFGLNRHQLFPYTGMAASARLQARDAQLLRVGLNCNMVRCSHYPQSPHFLDECDRLGLMVWEEPPGWQYVGDESFQATFMQNVQDMILRDRNRPSVIVWGTRPNETYDFPTLYASARALADELDGTRQTTGAMANRSTEGWAEDVFAYDDYSSVNGNAELQPPLPGIPYFVSEAVGALDGPPLFRWIDPSSTLQAQARLHAQVHAIAFGNPAYEGVLGWCGIDYDSLDGGVARSWQGLRWPGIMDTFRVFKPGAAFYRSQVSPSTQPVILPAFFWDFGPNSPADGPGPNTFFATNCESLAISVDGALVATATPDPAYATLPYPPVIVNLTVDGATLPQLTVTGYVDGTAVASLQMAGNPAGDHLQATLQDAKIVGDGSDATRLTFRAVDAFGNQRPYVAGDVTLSLAGGAAEIIGENPFQFAAYGGVGSVFVRSIPHRTGLVQVTATHPTLGAAAVARTVVAPCGR
jgi:beta-galactosidase